MSTEESKLNNAAFDQTFDAEGSLLKVEHIDKMLMSLTYLAGDAGHRKMGIFSSSAQKDAYVRLGHNLRETEQALETHNGALWHLEDMPPDQIRLDVAGKRGLIFNLSAS